MDFLQFVNRFLWNRLFLPCFVLCGLLLTVRCRGLQFRRLGRALALPLGGRRDPAGRDGLTPLQAASTALAATVGTGNIVGAVQAVAMGGPGAVFWLWAAAFLGMIIKYAEIFLGLRYRQTDQDGRPVGGPMYILRLGLGRPFAPLAGLYAALAALSTLCMGCMSQVSGCVRSLCQAVQVFVPLSGDERFWLRLGLGLALALAVLPFSSGDARLTGRAMERLVPAMALLFLGLTGTVLLRHAGRLPAVLGEIFASALRPEAPVGAAWGLGLKTAVQWGVRRGAFSNEAGLGSAAIIHASARAGEPAEHALWGIFEVFADTVVICTATALAVLCSGVEIPWGTTPGPELLGAAFATVFGKRAAPLLLAAALSLFAFSTVAGCSVYGLRCAEYLLGPSCAGPYRAAFLSCVLFGAVLSTAAVWTVADTANVLMSLPNFLALFLLSGETARAARAKFFQK